MTTDQRTPQRRRHLQHDKATSPIGRAAPATISPDPVIESTHTLRHTIERATLSVTTRHRRRKADPTHNSQEPPNAALRLAVDHAAPHAKITIAEREGAITLTGTAVTPAEKNGAGFACWALSTTTAVYNNVTLTP
jgi:hypothetical protein